MGTTIDLRPNIILAWHDVENLMEEAIARYPDLDKVIFSRSQENTIINSAYFEEDLYKTKLEIALKDGIPIGKIYYRLAQLGSITVIVE